MKKTKIFISYAVFMALLVAADYFSKLWMVNNLKGKEDIVWIKNVFELQYLENTGAAFSSFLGKQGFLITISSLIFLVVLWKFIQIPEGKRYGFMRFSFALLMSGAIGNLIDRVKQGYVVDFFYFMPINFPRFNVADCYVCVAMGLIVIFLIFVYKDEETEFLFHIKKK